MRSLALAVLLLGCVAGPGAAQVILSGGGGGGGAVASVTGAGTVTCDPTTGNVVCTGVAALPSGLGYSDPCLSIAGAPLCGQDAYGLFTFEDGTLWDTFGRDGYGVRVSSPALAGSYSWQIAYPEYSVGVDLATTTAWTATFLFALAANPTVPVLLMDYEGDENYAVYIRSDGTLGWANEDDTSNPTYYDTGTSAILTGNAVNTASVTWTPGASGGFSVTLNGVPQWTAATDVTAIGTEPAPLYFGPWADDGGQAITYDNVRVTQSTVSPALRVNATTVTASTVTASTVTASTVTASTVTASTVWLDNRLALSTLPGSPPSLFITETPPSSAGVGNVGIGPSALASLTTGTSNVALGQTGLFRLTEGGSNIALGTSALEFVTTGNSNIGIGANTCSTVTTGSQNICLGLQADVPSASGSSQVRIAGAHYYFGTGAISGESNAYTMHGAPTFAGAVTFGATSGTPAAYACFTAGGVLVASATPCVP